jgi:hypothetical protein
MNIFIKSVTLACLCLQALAQSAPSKSYYQVEARPNADSSVWKTYTAKTLDRMNLNLAPEPEVSTYGGWKTDIPFVASGYYRVEKRDGRFWFVDPEGYPYIHKGVAVFRPGRSVLQSQSLQKKYGSKQNWARKEAQLLKNHGFNGTGAWSDHDLLRENPEGLTYTIIVNPMGNYKADHLKKFNGKYEMAGWQGYRYDLIMVFDPEFDSYVQKAMAPLAKYREDKHLLGYFTDNELPWKNDALDRHLRYLKPNEAGYKAAKTWLVARKGKDASLEKVTDEDRRAFNAFYFETYMKKVVSALRKVDPNHLYLGCRFNQEKEELSNPDIFRVAGKYMDVISINHYRKWEPVQEIMENWVNWSGKPFIITEWYTKGEDSGLPNRTGAGWNVPTQKDRGYFYQNFTLELIKSKGCVGWHWFTYQDNDPLDLSTDPSNRDSNKGIVDSKFQPYTPLLEEMKKLNDHVYRLTEKF